MKKIISILCMATLVVFAGTAQAQTKKECTVKVPAAKNSQSRGKNKFIIDPAKIIEIPQKLAASRGANSCYLVVENTSNEDVNVFVDSVYVGFVAPAKKGYINKPNGYATLHCWTTSGQYKWFERGDCKDCKMTFVLSKP